jgi:catechol 2,3-dioxygenase-like lactoylglutathione lyase family enzyme
MPDNLLLAVPVLRVSDMDAARAYYCDKLGFSKDWIYQPGEGANPAYASFSREGAGLQISSFPGDGVTGSSVTILVRDVDGLHREFSARGVRIELEPTDQTWGNREMYLRDPDGNSLRFIQHPVANET